MNHEAPAYAIAQDKALQNTLYSIDSAPPQALFRLALAASLGSSTSTRNSRF